MGRCIAVVTSLLLPMAAFAAQKPSARTDASVKLWLDTTANNACEQSQPASGGWTIRNNEGRNVEVTVHRIMEKNGATREDQMQDTLGPRESRELGCEISDEGRQTLTLVRAVY